MISSVFLACLSLPLQLVSSCVVMPFCVFGLLTVLVFGLQRVSGCGALLHF